MHEQLDSLLRLSRIDTNTTLLSHVLFCSSYNAKPCKSNPCIYFLHALLSNFVSAVAGTSKKLKMNVKYFYNIYKPKKRRLNKTTPSVKKIKFKIKCFCPCHQIFWWEFRFPLFCFLLFFVHSPAPLLFLFLFNRGSVWETLFEGEKMIYLFYFLFF